MTNPKQDREQSIKELDAVGKELKGIRDRIEDWEELAPELERRIQEEARVQRQTVPPERLRDLGEEALFKPLDYGYLMRQPYPKVRGELGEKDIFVPVEGAEPGTMASGRELQSMVPREFEWTDATLDRLQEDILNYYVDGEVTP